jgi:hypothetical protein
VGSAVLLGGLSLLTLTPLETHHITVPEWEAVCLSLYLPGGLYVPGLEECLEAGRCW